jgi:hypothetical protein
MDAALLVRATHRRKSQYEHARSRGAAGRKPVRIARSMISITSVPERRAASLIATSRSVNDPVAVQ